MNQVVLWIVENPYLDSWDARIPYFNAKTEERRLYLYGMDLIWLDVKRHYNNLPQPSDVANKKPEDVNITPAQIKKRLLKKLKGE